EAGGRTVGQGERQGGVLAADRHPDIGPGLLVVVAVVAGNGQHQVEAVDAAAQEHVHDGVVAVDCGLGVAAEEQGGAGGAGDCGGAAALEEATAIEFDGHGRVLSDSGIRATSGSATPCCATVRGCNGA